VVEAKQSSVPVGGGLQQALDYAEALDVPFAFSPAEPHRGQVVRRLPG
jgi:type I site-specific restriction endonuclease